MPNRFQPSLWFVLAAAVVTAGTGAGIQVLFPEESENSVAHSDCAARKAAPERRQDDWGKIFDGLSA